MTMVDGFNEIYKSISTLSDFMTIEFGLGKLVKNRVRKKLMYMVAYEVASKLFHCLEEGIL
jgi:hypothetical protein